MADKEHDASWAIKLLTPDAAYQETVLGSRLPTVVGATVGLICAIGVNIGSKRPIWSGIQKHIAYTIIGGSFGRFIQLVRFKQTSERDATFRHYISLHPELFPEPERKKFGEILFPWLPVR